MFRPRSIPLMRAIRSAAAGLRVPTSLNSLAANAAPLSKPPAPDNGLGGRRRALPEPRPEAGMTRDMSGLARAHALFLSHLSAHVTHPHDEIVAAIVTVLRRYGGSAKCAAEVAAAYGDHPGEAASRMRWARDAVEAAYRLRRSTSPRSSAAQDRCAEAGDRPLQSGKGRGEKSCRWQAPVPTRRAGMPFDFASVWRHLPRRPLA
ncbi:hypothetical protein GCM10010166_65710 [Couchioplanes caeruleus subsp. azureus]|nr:hypothetical protein GCM10010166_65710 [Couchioplanes caeruleus subsp. azureus]